MSCLSFKKMFPAFRWLGALQAPYCLRSRRLDGGAAVHSRRDSGVTRFILGRTPRVMKDGNAFRGENGLQTDFDHSAIEKSFARGHGREQSAYPVFQRRPMDQVVRGVQQPATDIDMHTMFVADFGRHQPSVIHLMHNGRGLERFVLILCDDKGSALLGPVFQAFRSGGAQRIATAGILSVSYHIKSVRRFGQPEVFASVQPVAP